MLPTPPIFFRRTCGLPQIVTVADDATGSYNRGCHSKVTPGECNSGEGVSTEVGVTVRWSWGNAIWRGWSSYK